MAEPIKFIPPLTVKSGQIQFVDACLPPLVAGDYQVKMSQEIKETEADEVPWNSDPYATKMEFSVDAPRFALKPADLHSVYPPANHAGAFVNALPHVVFTRRTLPWERTLDRKTPRAPFPPWMGLLLLTEAELRILDEQGQDTGRHHEMRPLPVVGDAAKGEDSLLFPRGPIGSATADVLVADLGQHTDDWKRRAPLYGKASAFSIDLPAPLFAAVAPRLTDLPWLAHVRQIDTGNKEVYRNQDKGWFAVVIGNRIPQPNLSHHAFLVSLEGFQDWLTDDWVPPPHKMVRLAVLANWTFECTGTLNFKTRMGSLNRDPDNKNSELIKGAQLLDSWLRLPYESFDAEDFAKPENIVNGAYARGYAAFRHGMRQGEKTVSWYRGPLVPLNYPKPTQLRELVSSGDELLRYDPTTGMFDVSYATAWQLGRLLALQNQGFALALDRTRANLRQQAESLVWATRVERALQGFPVGGDIEAHDIDRRLLEKLGEDLGTLQGFGPE